MSEQLDAVDAKILDLIQHDAGLSVAEIAERVGLSSSPCWRRIKRLEDAGVIQRRVTILDRERLGLTFQIMDDLLDVSGSQESMGKRVGKDAARGKLTFPGLLGIDESRRRATVLTTEAIKALAPLGSDVEVLEDLARYVVERNH